MSFLTGTQPEVIFKLPAAVTKNTYTTEALFSGVLGTNPVCKVPGGYFSDNPNPLTRGLWLKCLGTMGQTASATFAINLAYDVTPGTKVNSVAVMTATICPPTAITAPWELEAWYTCTAYNTSTMSLQVNGKFRCEGVASGGAGVSTALCTAFSGSISTSIDPRVNQYIELFGTWSASNAANTTTLNQMLLFGLD